MLDHVTSTVLNFGPLSQSPYSISTQLGQTDFHPPGHSVMATFLDKHYNIRTISLDLP